MDCRGYRRGMPRERDKEEMKVDDNVLGADWQLDGKSCFEVGLVFYNVIQAIETHDGPDTQPSNVDLNGGKRRHDV
jgi:hypothetical protein